MTAHAKKRPPSAARRWLSCAASVNVVPLYPNVEGAAAIRGTKGHALLETALWLGTVPDDEDQDLVESVMVALEYVQQRREYFKEHKIDFEEFHEVTLDIHETGEFGTADIIFVWEKGIEVIDFKNGYVPVGRKPLQLQVYLLGAIAKHGERKNYSVTVIQPNYNHADGPVRTDTITNDDLEWLRREIHYSMTNENTFAAGKHCKDTYCPHRGTCATFLAWAPENLQLAYFPGDVNAISDEELAEALDQADVLQGWRDALRSEAMRRMLNMDRNIPTKKLVKAKQDRDFADEKARERVFAAARDLGATDDDLYDRVPKSVKGVENFYKKVFKPFGRGKYKEPFEAALSGALKPQNSSLTVVNDYDGRPAYRRGGEFGAIVDPAQEPSTPPVGRLPDIL